jgi:hypothetical protein
MSNEIVVALVVLLVAVVAGVGWRLMRGRASPDAVTTRPPVQDLDPPAEPVEEAPPPVAPPVVATPTPVTPPRPAPAPPPVRPPPPARAAPPPPAPVPPAPVPPTIVMAPPVPRPAPPVLERVLALDTATEAEWDVGIAVALSAAQAASVATALGAERHPSVLAVRFEPGAAMAVARGEQAVMRRLGESGSGGRWLDGTTSTLVAATALASHAHERFLGALGDEMRELKALLASLPPKLAAGNGRLKPLVQDLSRFAREAHDNFATAVGKVAFRERVEEAGGRALAVWRELVERADGVRGQLDALSRTPRFGEVQVEKALALLRDLNDQERLQEIAGRAVAAAHVLRLALGETPGEAGTAVLTSAIAACESGLALDRSVAARLVDAEKAAKGDPYVGKAEFEANRAAVRKLLERFTAPPGTLALQRLEAARGAEALDADGAVPRRLLVRNGVGVCAMRWSAGA